MASRSQSPSGPDNDSSKGSGKGPTARQLAAQARAETEAAERRRERLIRTIGGAVVLLAVAGLIAVGIIAGRGNDTDTTANASPAPSPDANAAIPPGVQKDTWGLQYGTGWTAANEAKLPTLQIWEDFQCPACKQVEAAAGAQLEELENSGTVKLLYRPATFLDQRQGLEQPNSSARATSAWGCAAVAGKTIEFHNAVFTGQPTEGAGFTDQQLKDFGATAGITGEAKTAFDTCVDAGTYLGWAANSQQKFVEEGVGGTPTGYLNGVELSGSELADIEGLKQKIAAATAK